MHHGRLRPKVRDRQEAVALSGEGSGRSDDRSVAGRRARIPSSFRADGGHSAALWLELRGELAARGKLRSRAAHPVRDVEGFHAGSFDSGRRDRNQQVVGPVKTASQTNVCGRVWGERRNGATARAFIFLGSLVVLRVDVGGEW